MEKLIELLNKYLFELGRKTIIESYKKDSLEDVCGTFRGIVFGRKDYPYTSIWGIEVISKKYRFIKRLVENDKINREKFGNSETKSSKYSDFELSYDTPREDYINILLMELAIQDEPINFLASILK